MVKQAFFGHGLAWAHQQSAQQSQLTRGQVQWFVVEVHRAVEVVGPQAGQLVAVSGLVIATDQDSARAYAALLRQISGRAPTVVLSDDPSSSDAIDDYANGQQRWMVAVRMVSEGVDVPRLAVCDPLTGEVIRSSKSTAVRYERDRPGELGLQCVLKRDRLRLVAGGVDVGDVIGYRLLPRL